MSVSPKPAPPVPSEVDLRGLEYMPLFGNHLFGSEFNAAASDGEWRAAVTLWWAAWNQVPAGSLPADDVALCRLSDLGRDLKAWRKVKERALHGFTLCDDGRLYHAFICAQALIAWDKRVKERERKAKWRADQDAKRAGREAPGDGDKSAASRGQERGRDADVPADGNRRDVTGRDDVGIPSEPVGSGAAAPPPRSARNRQGEDPPATPAAPPPASERPTDRDMVFANGVTLLTAAGVRESNARSFLAAQCKAHGDTAVRMALDRCAAERPVQPVPWLQAALKVAGPPPNRQQTLEDANRAIAAEWAAGSTT